jgi:tetratricopeptide (TPR) repeat protein
MGVRGAIDGGGYSAPAGVKARAETKAMLIRAQIEALQSVYRFDGAVDCGREQGLVQKAASHPEDGGANYEVAAFYLAHAKIEKALPYLERAHQLDRSDESATRALAITALLKQDATAVRSLLLPLVSQRDRCDLRDLIAIAEESAGNWAAASEQFRQAAACSRSERDSFAYGVALLLLDQVTEARKTFADTLPSSKNQNLLNIGLALVLYQQGQTGEALDKLLRVAESAPAFTMPYAVFTDVFNGRSDVTSPNVILRLQRLVQAAPENAEALVALASVLWQQQNRRAEGLLRRALALDPRMTRAHILLAAIETESQQYESAITEYRQALDQDASLVELHYKLGLTYLRSGQKELGQTELAENRQMHEGGDNSPVSSTKEGSIIVAAIRNKAMRPCGTA